MQCLLYAGFYNIILVPEGQGSELVTIKTNLDYLNSFLSLKPPERSPENKIF